MRVWHDYSCVGKSDKEFISRGFAEDDLHCVRISFEYTAEQQRENVKKAETMAEAEWSDYCDTAKWNNSAYIFPVMEAIAGSFVCYQYDKENQPPFDSGDWELFFWCNDFQMTTNRRYCGRDYSYLTLSFNERHSTANHMEICKRLLAFLKNHFSHLENLSVALQHTTRYFDKEICCAAAAVEDRLGGTRGSYRGMDGRFIRTDSGVVFMKKRARSHCYKISPYELLLLSWGLEAA